MYGIKAFAVLIGEVAFVFPNLFLVLMWGTAEGVKGVQSTFQTISLILLFVPIILDIIGLMKGEKVLPLLNLAVIVIIALNMV